MWNVYESGKRCSEHAEWMSLKDTHWYEDSFEDQQEAIEYAYLWCSPYHIGERIDMVDGVQYELGPFGARMMIKEEDC